MKNKQIIILIVLIVILNVIPCCTFNKKQDIKSDISGNSYLIFKRLAGYNQLAEQHSNDKSIDYKNNTIGIDLFPMVYKKSINAFYQYIFSDKLAGIVFIHKHGYDIESSNSDKSIIKWSFWESNISMKWYWDGLVSSGGYLKFGAGYESGHVYIKNPNADYRLSDWGILLGGGYTFVVEEKKSSRRTIATPVDIGIDLFIKPNSYKWEASDGTTFYHSKIEPSLIMRIGFPF